MSFPAMWLSPLHSFHFVSSRQTECLWLLLKFHLIWPVLLKIISFDWQKVMWSGDLNCVHKSLLWYNHRSDIPSYSQISSTLNLVIIGHVHWRMEECGDHIRILPMIVIQQEKLTTFTPHYIILICLLIWTPHYL